MTYIIHFTVDGKDDEAVISGNSLPEIQLAAEDFMKKRGLDAEKNNMWSQEIS